MEDNAIVFSCCARADIQGELWDPRLAAGSTVWRRGGFGGVCAALLRRSTAESRATSASHAEITRIGGPDLNAVGVASYSWLPTARHCPLGRDLRRAYA